MNSPATPPAVRVRPAALADAPAINQIYNHYVANTAITFDIEPWSTQRRADWLGQFTADDNAGGPYYALVAELDGELAGFAYNSAFRARAAYRRATETTIYTAAQHQSRGIGAALYHRLFDLLATTDLHRGYAVVALPNARSIAFHQRFNFTPIATLSEVGYKFGEYIDVAWLEKKLK